MGLAIDRCTFSEDEYVQAGIRLRENLAALRELLERPGFGVGPASLGAELEMAIVGPDAKALPVNREVLARSLEPRLQLELDRFNLEYNLPPVPAAGRPFGTMRKELEVALDLLGKTAAQFDGRIVPIGILPTLTIEELQTGWMTDLPRYHALCAGILRLREDSVHIRINGAEPLEAEFETCTVEGANTSFQVHLRVDPDRFAPCYNAAQMATPLALAIGANSPYFLGHRLWEETRIALFKQSVDTRRNNREWRRMARVPFGHGWVRKGAYELFAESCYLYPILIPVCSDADDLGAVRAGGIPELAELRLHQGTIWNWNRPVYDSADGGHLRIELRALPAGPTPIDMMANAAYLAGLTAGLANHVDRLLDAFPFRYADFNFYRAAQQGLGARLLWPTLDGTSPREATAAALCREMLPIADEGLDRIGVEEAERKNLLGLVRDRLDSGTTPAGWQRRTVDGMSGAARDQSMILLVEEYLAKVATGRPVTEW